MIKKINKLEAVHSFTVMLRDCNFNTDKTTNKNNILFGGKILHDMDFAGAKVVRRATYGVGMDMIVTASMDRTNFEKPAFIGDIITYVATIKAIGTTSIQVRLKVTRESLDGFIEDMCSSNMTFVTIKDGKPFPHELSFDKLKQ